MKLTILCPSLDLRGRLIDDTDMHMHYVCSSDFITSLRSDKPHNVFIQKCSIFNILRITLMNVDSSILKLFQ